MAQRRMFSLSVVDTDKFLSLPVGAQCLYFHLGMRADDYGFLSSVRAIMAFVPCTDGDLELLISKGFLIPFGDGANVVLEMGR